MNKEAKIKKTRHLEALTWDALVHTVTLALLYVDNKNLMLTQYSRKQCYFSLLAEALNTRKRASASREVSLVLRQQMMT